MNEPYILESVIPDTAKIYDRCRIIGSTLLDNTSVGDDAVIRDSVLCENAEIGRRTVVRNSTIGIGTYTGSGCNISHANIGKYCAIAWNVSVGGADHNLSTLAMTPLYRITRNKEDAANPYPRSWGKDCIIGNDVWLSAGVSVLRGVVIGDGVAVGANSVVTRDLPPYSIAVGAPAKAVRYRFSAEMIEFLLDFKWWEYPAEFLGRHANVFVSENEGEIRALLEEMKEQFSSERN